MIIRKATVEDMEGDKNLSQLITDYADEAKNKDLPKQDPNFETYRVMEKMGVLHIFAAQSDDQVVGFITLLITPVPHYSQPIATSESFYVAPAHRKSGTGRKLLDAAEELAKEKGAAGLFISAPTGGRLEKAMPIMGYRPSNTVFFRSLS